MAGTSHVYTVRLAAGATSAPSSGAIWTHPGDATYVLRDVVLGNITAAAGNVNLLLRLVSTADLYVVTEIALASGHASHWEGTLPLAPGELLWISSTIAPVTYVLSGWKFLEPA